MFLFAPLLIPAGAAIASAAANFFGQRSANKQNLEEAGRNREFQERMSSTQWQRGVRDMEAAGLNPALAYSQGGASSPSGSTGRVESTATDAVGSALAVKTATEQFKLLRAQKKNVDEQTKKTRFEARKEGLSADMEMGRYMYYFDRDGTATPKMMELLRAEHGQKIANSARSVQELGLSRLREPEMKAMAQLFERMGEGGKGIQQLMPLILQLLRNR